MNSFLGTLKKSKSNSSYGPQEQHVIPLENITLSRQLGKGEFGSVHQAAWYNPNTTDQIQVLFCNLFECGQSINRSYHVLG